MQYVKFPKLNIEVSRFRMGCMRFPKTEDAKGKSVIDEAESIRMIRYAVNNGVNYFDTAYVYGDSEKILRKALSGGLREKVFIATKCPVGNKHVKGPGDFRDILAEEMERLRTDHIDFYLLHGLSTNSWEKVKKLGLLDQLDRAKKEKKIKYAGFSFHDNVWVFKDIIDSYPWDICQIQLNFRGDEYQAGVEGMKYEASKGIGVVIMEPLFGGLLGENVPQDIVDKWNSSGIIRPPAEWAFRWVADFPEVTVVLSGISTMGQLRENIRIFEDALPGSLTPEESRVYKKINKLYDSRIKVGCTGSAYCLP